MNKEHSAVISSLTWNGNGVYLLSGDDNGLVLLNKFQGDTLQPVRQITNENSSILQLRFHPLHHNKIVLISSLQRTIIAKIDQIGQIVITQVGQKSRKMLAPYGADFGYAENDACIYSSRPGLRLWLSDCDGTVQKTMIFKDSLSNLRSKLILLSYREEYSNVDPQFGPVFSLANGLVVSYSPSSFFILDTGVNFNSSGQVNVLHYCRFAPKNLRYVTVFHNEIFLLLDNRTLIRVSDQPDQFNASQNSRVDRPITPATTKSVITPPSIKATASSSGLPETESDMSKLHQSDNQNSAKLITTLESSLSRSLSSTVIPKESNCQNVNTLVINSIKNTDITLSEQSRATAAENGNVLSANTESQSSIEDAEMDGDSLVYASYIGRNKRLKLIRRSKSSSAVSPAQESGEPALLGPWLPNSSSTHFPIKTQDELQMELEQKDRLLAEILQFDRLNVIDNDPHDLTCSTDSYPVEDGQSIDENDDCPPLPEENGNVENPHDQKESADDIYTKYANDGDEQSYGLEISPLVQIAKRASPTKEQLAVTTQVRRIFHYKPKFAFAKLSL